MSSRKRWRGQSSARVESDPFCDIEESPAFDHKLAQLCEQVADSLGCTLSCDCEDPLLSGLVIASVVPAPSARRLRVMVYPQVWSDDFQAADIMERLERATGFLRAEVAAAINRKRTPELVFQVMHPDEVDL